MRVSQMSPERPATFISVLQFSHEFQKQAVLMLVLNMFKTFVRRFAGNKQTCPPHFEATVPELCLGCIFKLSPEH